MNDQKLLEYAVNGAINNLEDIGAPLNPMLITDKGTALFIDERSCKDPQTAAYVELNRLLKNFQIKEYVLVFDSRTSFNGEEPIDGVHFVPGNQHDLRQDSYFLPYLIKSGKVVVADPPQLHVIGSSNSLFKETIQTDLQPETLWKQDAEQGMRGNRR